MAGLIQLGVPLSAVTRPRTAGLNVLMVLPALTEATGPLWRPVKYALFPPLGLAQLAAYLDPERDHVQIVDEHVQPEVPLDGSVGLPESAGLPDLVIVQSYITNAHRAYAIADHFRARGSFVAIGGLHATSLPHEAAAHTDAVFCGPGEATFPLFLQDLREGRPRPFYDSRNHPRTLEALPPVRRDLIDRTRYLVPNSIVVTRGCPFRCDFCYKEAFFAGGRSFYTQRVDDALAEIERLPGRHLYFLDDHLLGDDRFARSLFREMEPMGRLFQGAATVDSVLRGDLIERAADAGLRSLFVGFESLDEANLKSSAKRQNLGRSYDEVVKRLDGLGIMINGSFVFGLDGDGPERLRADGRLGRFPRRHHRDLPRRHAVPRHRFLPADRGRGPAAAPPLGRVRHAPGSVPPARDDGGRAGRRLPPGVPELLLVAEHPAWGEEPRDAEAPAQARGIRGGVEEVRAGVELADPGKAGGARAAGAGGRAGAGDAGIRGP